MLEVRAVCKSFGGVSVLNDVSLTVREGEFFSLLGGSGSGKTTLLRAIAGFIAPDRGDLCLDGASFVKDSADRRPFHMVFQRYALFPHLSVRRNIAFGLEAKRVPKAEIDRRVDEALALVALETLGDRRPETLSGGQQQRVAVARAIVGKPRVLLLDEPLSALDLKLRQRMQTELRALQRRLNMTFLFVTHAQDEALSISDRVAVLHRGRLEQVGTPQELYEQPRTAFVATFVGNQNRLQDIDAHPALAGLRARARRLDGDATDLLIRPERVQIVPREQGMLVGKVRQVFYKGASLDVEVDLGTQQPWMVTLRAGEAAPSLNALVGLRFDAADAWLAPRETAT